MREVTVSASVRARPEDVFDFLLDNRGDELWCPLAVVELAEQDGRTRIRRSNHVILPGRAQQVLWWTLANVVLRLQVRNLRRQLDS